MEYVVKVMKDKGVYLEISNCERKLLEGDFLRSI